MINLIIDYEDGDEFKNVLESVDEEGNRLYPYPYFAVGEMKDAWCVILEPEQVDDLEDALKLPPLRMILIGTYNEDGSQYIWTEPGHIQRNHSINKYANGLNNMKRYDANGDIVEDRPHTEEEAKEVQVNNVYGWPKRVL